ncbi:MAG: prepilin-type N-terminal cleavage/methylation domain-containing protein [Lentisphaerota bacterium]
MKKIKFSAADNSAYGLSRGSVKNLKSKFTLTELLVVIAIIAILAALLLPALKSAKDSAKKIVCVNNLKTIGSCFSFYLDDNVGWYPPSYRGGLLWFQDPACLIQYTGVSSAKALTSTDWVALCPMYKAMKHNGNYGMSQNWFWNGGLSKPYHREMEIKQPSRTLLVIDVFYEGANVNAAEQYFTGSGWTDHHFRHRLKANVLFADQHVADENGPLPLYPDPIWAGK